MIKPPELDSDPPHGLSPFRACDVWDMIAAAARGDVDALRRLLARDPDLHQAEYWYTRPLHFAVREGHAEAVRLLIEAGAFDEEPDRDHFQGDDLVAVARERGHDAVAALLEAARRRRPRVQPATSAALDHPIHAAAAADDEEAVRRMLDADPQLVDLADRQGGTPLHRAVDASARRVVALLVDRGADIHAVHGAGGQPIDRALWKGDVETARLLVDRGATHDVVIAAALGNRARVAALLDEDPRRIEVSRPCDPYSRSGSRPLSAAIRFGHDDLVPLLLDRGADPNWPEQGAPRGVSLHAASRTGNRALVELLLDRDADPNGKIDSWGSATLVAKTPELRALLLARGGRLNAFDLASMGEDDELVRRVEADPSFANTGCGGAFAAVCKAGKRELLVRLLAAGARVPPILTQCRFYLLHDPELLRLLLASGMDPDLPNWQHATPLHDLCTRDAHGNPKPHRELCATILLDAGATISAKDEDYRSTPLAWAARHNLPDMIDLLLARGAPTNLPDDEPWATPLAWAIRRGHADIAERLRRAGATA